ncbi:MAG: HD domain-containing protein [Bdellovibrionota bacterium]|nr:MAG: HD domain-containing protein [Bdellovibrionota bacterium]
MSVITFADVVHQAISFSQDTPEEALLLRLIDTPWVQRLRDISQTANTRLVYMFSEHSRFGHCLGVAYLAALLLRKLETRHPDVVRPYRAAVLAAALLHDVGHLAPGAHTAYRTWFPDVADNHEAIAAKICCTDAQIAAILSDYSQHLPQQVASVIEEDPSLPAWTWELLSGGGWNVDRGNWCIVDSILAGVQYGHYNIPALTDSLDISPQGQLILQENRLDAMMHFAVSRHAMYRQIYQHRVLLSADTINAAIVRRARDLGVGLDFADDTMREVLAAHTPDALSLHAIFRMREAWWRYHLFRWADGSDGILADLSSRLINRRLFKTVRLTPGDSTLRSQAQRAVEQIGLDPRYYLHEVSTQAVHSGDSHQAIQVRMDSGHIRPLADADPLFRTMMVEDQSTDKRWLVMPSEAKALLGRER